MQRKYFFLILLLTAFLGCSKNEGTIVLEPDAGNSFLDVENDGYVVTLNAQPPGPGQQGIWRLYLGENGRFEDPADPHTRFYGEPGETYLLGWEISQGKHYKASTISVSFRPLHPVVLTSPGDTLRGNVSWWLEAEAARYGATGHWELVDGEGGTLLSPDSSRTAFVGEARTTYTLRWVLTYGSKSAAEELTFTTDSLRADAGEDDLDILTAKGAERKFYTLQAYLPAGGSGRWELLQGTPARIYLPDNPASLFEGVADTLYRLVWHVQVGPYRDSDTLQLHFRGKWGLWEDPRDKQKYRYIRIGNTEWMVDNYNYDFPSHLSQYGRSWYYGQTPRANIVDGHPVETEEERRFYGRLYNYFAAVEMTPDGWRLPRTEDFQNLLRLLGGEFYAWEKVILGGEAGTEFNFPGALSASWDNINFRDNFYGQDMIGLYMTSDKVIGRPEILAYVFDKANENSFQIRQSMYIGGLTVRYVRDVNVK